MRAALFKPLPDCAKVHEELKRRGVTLMLLWEEYRWEHADGYGYSWAATKLTIKKEKTMQLPKTTKSTQKTTTAARSAPFPAMLHDRVSRSKI